MRDWLSKVGYEHQQEQQQADDEQQQHELLASLYRLEQCGGLRSDIEEVARGLRLLEWLHAPLR